MKIELINHQMFKEAFESISKLVDEVICEVDSEGFRIRALDRSHICFVSLDLKPTVFDSFECEVPERISLDTLEFMKILKRLKKDNTLTFKVDGNNFIIGMLGDVDREFKIKIIDTEYNNTNIPSIEFPNSVSIKSSLIKDAIGDMELFDEKLYFTIDKEYFKVDTAGEFGDANFEYLHGENINEVTRSCYSIPKLNDIFKASKFSDVCTIYLGNDIPIKISFELDTDDGELMYLLAPRLEAEE